MVFHGQMIARMRHIRPQGQFGRCEPEFTFSLPAGLNVGKGLLVDFSRRHLSAGILDRPLIS